MFRDARNGRPLCGVCVDVGGCVGRCWEDAIEETDIPDHLYGGHVWVCAKHGGVAPLDPARVAPEASD